MKIYSLACFALIAISSVQANSIRRSLKYVKTYPPLTEEVPVQTYPTLTEEVPAKTYPTLTEEVPAKTYPTLTEEVPVQTYPTLTEEVPAKTYPTLTEEVPAKTYPTLTEEVPAKTYPTLTEEVPAKTYPTLTEEVPAKTYPTLTEEVPVQTYPTLTEEVPAKTYPTLTEEVPVQTYPTSTEEASAKPCPTPTEGILTAGSVCTRFSSYYSQCLPETLPTGSLCGQDDGTNDWKYPYCSNGETCVAQGTDFYCRSTSHVTTTTTTDSVESVAATTSGTVATWGDCTGGKTCTNPTSQCIAHSQWYAQCKPATLPAGELCGQRSGATTLWLYSHCPSGQTCKTLAGNDTDLRCQ
ncbi:hypothetical protein JM18_000338 [Phytophthora kernoviae]|uniref:CBM1 domain-containing protein n=1 Tax=Phytophthora kernoviae TaxID=325452 RepID=A0A921VEK8_9STRA|nr:hypothetical protein JM18_000338 [Phytophthora kernoviae]